MTERDGRILKALKAAIAEAAHIDMKSGEVKCRMEDNAILVEGAVERLGDKKKALLAAMRVAGADSGVIDRLRVKPSVHMGDKEILAHVNAAIASEDTLKPFDIQADVKDGVVDLEGSVVSLSHKRLAGTLAWWVPGSVDVINSLEVAPPEEDSDDEVNDALRLVLDKDRLVDASQITASTANWAVTLTGVAGSEAEKNAAEEDAWSIWGVNDVVNRIIVRPKPTHEAG